MGAKEQKELNKKVWNPTKEALKEIVSNW